LQLTYERIDNLESKEKQMLTSLQTTMKEHSTLMLYDKKGALNTDLVDRSISKFNYQIK